MSLFGILDKEKEVFSVKYDGRVISITQKGSVRTLRCNEVIFSRIDKKTMYTHEYWDFFLPLGYLYEKPEMLMIGLGGGTIAFQFSKMFQDKPNLAIVELDKHMAEIYQRFLEESIRSRIIVGDGAEYVSVHPNEYDIIILDAYDPSGKIPGEFHERKFVEDAYGAIKDKGILAVNCIGSMLGPELDSLVQNLSEKFEVYRLDTSYFTANIILVCTKNMGKDEMLGKLHEKMVVDDQNAFLMKAYDASKRVFITL